jgi:hypothetical protein
LGISLFNLVPGCYKCNNQQKHAIPFGKETHLHPFEDGFGNDVLFKAEPVVRSGNPAYKVELNITVPDNSTKYRKLIGFAEDDKELVGNINVFKLRDLYNGHLANQKIDALFLKKDRLTPAYVRSLGVFLDRLNTEESRVYYSEFEAYFNEADFQRSDFSKLKKDIILEIFKDYNLPLNHDES